MRCATLRTLLAASALCCPIALVEGQQAGASGQVRLVGPAEASDHEMLDGFRLEVTHPSGETTMVRVPRDQGDSYVSKIEDYFLLENVVLAVGRAKGHVIFRFDASTGKLLQQVNTIGRTPVASPGDRTVAYVGWIPNGPLQDSRVFVLDVVSGRESVVFPEINVLTGEPDSLESDEVFENRTPMSLLWSRDSRALLFVSTPYVGNRMPQLVRVTLPDAERTRPSVERFQLPLAGDLQDELKTHGQTLASVCDSSLQWVSPSSVSFGFTAPGCSGTIRNLELVLPATEGVETARGGWQPLLVEGDFGMITKPFHAKKLLPFRWFRDLGQRNLLLYTDGVLAGYRVSEGVFGWVRYALFASSEEARNASEFLQHCFDLGMTRLASDAGGCPGEACWVTPAGPRYRLMVQDGPLAVLLSSYEPDHVTAGVLSEDLKSKMLSVAARIVQKGREAPRSRRE